MLSTWTLRLSADMPLCMLYEVMVIGRGDMMCNRSV